MDVKDKIVTTLVESLDSEYIRLEDDDGISGFAVSRRFEGLSPLDRQDQIEEALSKAPLTPAERRRVLMIAGLTPAEYEAVGVPIRVQRVHELPGGKVEILLRGGYSDAQYVRGALQNQKGVETTDPRPVPGSVGEIMAFEASGTEATPLTKPLAIRFLAATPYIEMAPNA